MHGHRAARLTAALAALVAAVVLAAALAACSGGGGGDEPQGGVAPHGASAVDAAVTNGATTFQMRDVVALMADAPSDEERFAAASLAAQKDAGKKAAAPRLDPGATPDYYGVANWAQSPRIRKFVDELPGVGPAGANGLGQYIPVATPDTVTYPGSDYYELAVREYAEKLHSDLPATHLRGYVQLNLGTDAGGRNTVRPAAVQYFGPLIKARRGRPVRIKFVNQLPAGGDGELSSPSTRPRRARGRGAEGGDEVYPTDRASLHLHGGLTPWISGGSQYQWVSPAGEQSPTAPVRPWSTCRTCGSTPGEARECRHARRHQRPRAGRDHALPAQRAERPLPLPARRHLRPDPAQRVRRGGGALHHRRRGGGRARRGQHRPSPPAAAPSPRRCDAGTVPAEELPLIIEDKTFVPSDAAGACAPPTRPGTSPAGEALAPCGIRTCTCPTRTGYANRAGSPTSPPSTPKVAGTTCPGTGRGYEGTVNGPVANPLYGTVPSQPEKNPGTAPLHRPERLPRHHAGGRHRVPVRQGPSARPTGCASSTPAATASSTCSCTTRGPTRPPRRRRTARPSCRRTRARWPCCRRSPR